MEDRDFWMLFGLIGLLWLNVHILSRHIKMHDEALAKLMAGDLDQELSAMPAPKED